MDAWNLLTTFWYSEEPGTRVTVCTVISGLGIGAQEIGRKIPLGEKKVTLILTNGGYWAVEKCLDRPWRISIQESTMCKAMDWYNDTGVLSRVVVIYLAESKGLWLGMWNIPVTPVSLRIPPKSSWWCFVSPLATLKEKKKQGTSYHLTRQEGGPWITDWYQNNIVTFRKIILNLEGQKNTPPLKSLCSPTGP